MGESDGRGRQEVQCRCLDAKLVCTMAQLDTLAVRIRDQNVMAVEAMHDLYDLRYPEPCTSCRRIRATCPTGRLRYSGRPI